MYYSNVKLIEIEIFPARGYYSFDFLQVILNETSMVSLIGFGWNEDHFFLDLGFKRIFKRFLKED